MVSVSSTTRSGAPVELTVAPSRGGKITSLRTGSREWLSQPAGGALHRSPSGLRFIDAEMCGWDECAPTIDPCVTAGGLALTDHGDLWDQEWVARDTESALVSVGRGTDWPYELRREISAQPGGFVLDYTVTSRASEPQPFLWAAHPQFVAEVGSWVELPGISQVMDVQAPDVPIPYERRLMDLPEGSSLKLWTLAADESRRALLHHPDGDSLDLSWGGDAVRWCGVWVDAAAYATARVLAIEPATGWYDSALRASDNGTVLMLGTGSSASWSLSIRFS